MGLEKKNPKRKCTIKEKISVKTAKSKPRPQRKPYVKKREKTVSELSASESETESVHDEENAPCDEFPTISNLSSLFYLKKLSLGQREYPTLRKFAKKCIVRDLSRNFISVTTRCFERRVTSIAWHPRNPQIVAAGSKGGEIILFNLKQCSTVFLPGIGPGGSIVGMKFHDSNPYAVYTASITGELRLEDFDKKCSQRLACTGCFEYEFCNLSHWFSSLDVDFSKKILLSGDTLGYARLNSTDGQHVWQGKKKLHQKKITHVEFWEKDPNIFVTASIDQTVKLWDLRKLEEEQKCMPIREFQHLKGVNSAYFSKSNGHSLLTTDQHSEIHVYKSPGWDEEIKIYHPHRQFQHLTPIKATWHPIEDIIVVGRYPELNAPVTERCIDFIDGSTGEYLYKMRSPADTILSLNVFNTSGDSLISGAGTSLHLWRDRRVFDRDIFNKASANSTLQTR